MWREQARIIKLPWQPWARTQRESGKEITVELQLTSHLFIKKKKKKRKKSETVRKKYFLWPGSAGADPCEMQPCLQFWNRSTNVDKELLSRFAYANYSNQQDLMSDTKLRVTDALICLKTEMKREFRKGNVCSCACVCDTHRVYIPVLFLKHPPLHVFQMATFFIKTFA